MSLTVAELAMAIGKDENYVRQHIRRENLEARRDGRRVLVEEAEAARWAKERGLPFSQTVWPLELDEQDGSRSARMTVLAIQETDGTSRNVFTLIRHRDRRSLGPWHKEENPSWYSDTVPVEDAGETTILSFYRCDGMMANFQELVQLILREGKLIIDGHEVHYALESKPRHHWAYQEHTPASTDSLKTPFNNFSAEVTEYWCFDSEIQDRWMTMVQAAPKTAEKMADALHFPVNQRSDRTGNLMIAKAEDVVGSEIMAMRGNRLILKVASGDWAEPPPGAYSATVWASHSGDKVMRRSFEISSAETVLNHESDVDLVGCEIYRNSDGECVDRYEANLLTEISVQMSVSGPPTEISIHGPRKGSLIKRQIDTNSTDSAFSVTDKDSEGMGQMIRQKYRVHLARENDRAARRDGKYRFRRGQVDEAVEHLARLVRPKPGQKGAVYFVDPHFKGESDTEVKVLTAILLGARGQSLNISCGRWEGSQRFNFPRSLIAQARIKSFTHADERGDPAIHDRYLLTPAGETIITNSVNGWEKDGVTFHSSPHEVYRTETEELWSLDAGVNANGVLVMEVEPW